MNSIKKRWIMKFAEAEREEAEKELENNEVTASQTENKENPKNTPSTDKDDLNNPNNSSKKLSSKTKKRLIGWTIFSVVTVGVISAVVYINVRDKETVLKNADITEITYDKFEKKGEVKAKDKSYSFDVSKNNAWSYIRLTNKYQIFLPRNNGSPLTFHFELIQDATGSQTLKINDLLQATYPSTSTATPPPTSTPTPPSTSTPTPPPTQALTQDVVNLFSGTSITAVPTPEGFNWVGLITMILPIAFWIILIIFIRKAYKMQMGAGADSMLNIGKSGANLAKSNVRFSDVAGIEEEKTELTEIVDYLKYPKKYSAMGARTPKGVILYGPPGTGKTLLAKAVAGEAGVPFLQTSGSQFEDTFVGVGAKRVRDLFAKARKNAPAIIFIDEIDSVASKRGKNEFGGGVADQTINQLLAEMDGFNTSTGIVVMAATNRLDVLDDAILRPGRFDRHVQVNLPDIKEREAILKIHARNKNISTKVDLYDIARRTPGFSGAQLENVLNEATLLAVRHNQTSVTVKDIDEAIDRVIAGPAKKSRVVLEEEKKLIAYHEAGHALVGLYTPGTDVVQKITIIPRGQAAGYTMQTPEGTEKRIQSKKDLLDNIRMTLGGRAAEEVIFGPKSITTGASNDLYKVTAIVRAMVMQLGMTKTGMTQFVASEGFINPYQQQKLYSDAKAKEIDAQVESIIQEEYTNAKNIISKNKKELDLIVDALLTAETILKEDIDYIHKHKKLPAAVLKIKEKNKASRAQDKKNAKADGASKKTSK